MVDQQVDNFDFKQQLENLQRISSAIVTQISEISLRHEALREEHEALCSSIFASGLLPSAALHTQKSARQHPGVVSRNNRHADARSPPPHRGIGQGNSRGCGGNGSGVVGSNSARGSMKSPFSGECTAHIASAPGRNPTAFASTIPQDFVVEQVAPMPMPYIPYIPGLYVCGGHASGVTLAGVDRLDVASGRWDTMLPMPTPRHGCAAAGTTGILYVFGGANDSGLPLATAERFDPLVGQWEKLPPVPTPRHGSACATAAGLLYVLGGYDGEGVLAGAERLDPAANRWEVLPSMQNARGRCAAAAAEGLVYAVGGTDDDGQELATMERFDPAVFQWTTLQPMPTARSGCAAVFVAGVLYVIGGRCASEKLAIMERFEPCIGRWESLAPMPTARDGCAAASAAGVIYVFGGRSFGQTLQVVERYDSHRGDWEQLPLMPKARCGCAAALA